MRDHRFDMTDIERERANRDKVDVTELMRGEPARGFVPTKSRAAKRARRKQQVKSRRGNRR